MTGAKFRDKFTMERTLRGKGPLPLESDGRLRVLSPLGGPVDRLE